MTSGLKNVPFADAVEDVSGGNPKTPQSEFQPVGRFPVVDQGKLLVAGFVDDEERLCRVDLPVIVFGDHTRCFKYVDFPFCIGADGVKVLRPKGDVEPRYLYHFLRQLHITEGGYDRHFKYLRRCEVLVPPISEQCRIAEVLDQAEAVRAKRRAAIAQIEGLTQAIFLEMFGDPATNALGWRIRRVGEVSEVQSGLQVSASRRSAALEVPYLRVANVFRGRLDLAEIKLIRASESEVARTALVKDDLLVVEGHGNPDEIGRCALWDGSIPTCVHQNHLIRARFSASDIDPRFACEYLNSPGGRRHLLRSGKTTSGLNTISVSDVKAVPIAMPPLDLQRAFASRAAAVDKLKAINRASLAQLDALFASLQHRGFRGEL